MEQLAIMDVGAISTHSLTRRLTYRVKSIKKSKVVFQLTASQGG